MEAPCSVTQCDADASCARLILARSAERCSRNVVFPRLSLSAHAFFSPTRCSTSNCTRCRWAQVAARRKKVPSGSAVLKSLSSPDSALVLSRCRGQHKANVLAA